MRVLHVQKTDDGTEVKLIGHCFSINLGTEHFDRNRLVELFDKFGFDSKVVPDIKKKSAFIRAVKKANSTRAVLHQIEETDTSISYQFDEKFVEELNGERKASFNTKAIISYIKPDDRVVCAEPEVLQMVYENIGWCQANFTKADVFKIIKQYIEEEADIIPLRRAGGSYFVPAKYTDMLLNMGKLLKELDPKGDFNLLEIPDLKSSKETVRDSIVEKHAQELAELEGFLDELSKEGDKLTDTVYKNRLEFMLRLGKKIEMEAELVEDRLQNTKDRVAEVRRMYGVFKSTGTKELPKADTEQLPDHIKELLGL